MEYSRRNELVGFARLLDQSRERSADRLLERARDVLWAEGHGKGSCNCQGCVLYRDIEKRILA